MRRRTMLALSVVEAVPVGQRAVPYEAHAPERPGQHLPLVRVRVCPALIRHPHVYSVPEERKPVSPIPPRLKPGASREVLGDYPCSFPAPPSSPPSLTTPPPPHLHPPGSPSSDSPRAPPPPPSQPRTPRALPNPRDPPPPPPPLPPPPPPPPPTKRTQTSLAFLYPRRAHPLPPPPPPLLLALHLPPHLHPLRPPYSLRLTIPKPSHSPFSRRSVIRASSITAVTGPPLGGPAPGLTATGGSDQTGCQDQGN